MFTARRFNPIAMAVPTGLSEAEWMEVGRKLSTVQGASLWWVGDWVDAGFAAYGKRVAYDLAQSATGMGRGSLYTFHVVSKHSLPARRVAELTFKHHQIVATPRLTIGQQDDLLRDAVALGLSVKQLRDEVTKIVGKKPRKRIKVTIYLWPETFVKMKELAQGKRPEWFAAEIVTDFVLAHHSEKLRAEVADIGNVHGVDITDDDLPNFSEKGNPNVQNSEQLWQKLKLTSTAELVGNTEALAELRTIQSGFVLIYGPYGCGKTSLALAYARERTGLKLGHEETIWHPSKAYAATCTPRILNLAT